MLVDSLNQFLHAQNLQEKPLVVALSGGADSVALLCLLYEIHQKSPLNLSAIHVHHGLSVNANAWMSFCQELCESLNVPLSCHKVQLQDLPRTSVEQQARQLRYQAIGQSLEDNSVLLTGHHLQDQTETFLLRLMRGAGLVGLGAMRPLSEFPLNDKKYAGFQVAKPLLHVSKAELIAYLQHKHQSWVEDESNTHEQYDRNFLRQQIIPKLATRWPQVNMSVSTSSQLLQQDAELLNEYLDDDLEFCMAQGFLEYPILNIDCLKNLSEQRRTALVRRFCYKQTGLTLSRNALQQVMLQMFKSADDAQPKVQLGDYWIKRHHHGLYCVHVSLLNVQCASLETVELNNPLQGAFAGKVLKVESLDDSVNLAELQIHYNQPQAKIKLRHGAGSKKVKELLKHLHCPPWWREQMPLLFYRGELIAVGDNLAADFKTALSVELR